MTEEPDSKMKVADYGKVSTFIEFMRCQPIVFKQHKNASEGINQVLAQSEPKVILLLSWFLILQTLLVLTLHLTFTELIN